METVGNHVQEDVLKTEKEARLDIVIFCFVVCCCQSAKVYNGQDREFSLMMIGILQMITPWVTVAVLFFTKKIANCFGRAFLGLAKQT